VISKFFLLEYDTGSHVKQFHTFRRIALSSPSGVQKSVVSSSSMTQCHTSQKNLPVFLFFSNICFLYPLLSLYVYQYIVTFIPFFHVFYCCCLFLLFIIWWSEIKITTKRIPLLLFVNLIFMDSCIVDYSVEIPTRCSFVIEFIIPKFIEGSTSAHRSSAGALNCICSI